MHSSKNETPEISDILLKQIIIMMDSEAEIKKAKLS
jgi:hypothetical protein